MTAKRELLEKSPQRDTAVPTPQGKILMIYTGGTIGMVENLETGALEPLDSAYLESNVPELNALSAEIEIISFEPLIDSSAITPDVWVHLAEIIYERYAEFDGFVVLHGTDTMAYTASALSFMFENLSKPIIFTGSQLPIGRLRTDGKENLITAIEMAIHRTPEGKASVPEVCIFFENYLMRGNRTSKISADQFHAFDSFNYPQLAYAGVSIKYSESLILRPEEGSEVKVYPVYDPNVLVLKLIPGLTQEVVETILGLPSLKGLVLETFGSGNAPMTPWFLDALGRAIDRGVVIVNITQCLTGYVDMQRYQTGQRLSDLGIINGYDATTEAASTKLMCLLGRGLSTEEVKELMAKPLSGEVSLEKIDRVDGRLPHIIL